MKTFRHQPSLLALSTCFALAAVSVTAQDVTLVSRDGKSKIAGELLGFDGQTYQVKTTLGDISVEAILFQCEGSACPEISRLDGDLTVASNYDRVADLAFALLSIVAQEERATVENQMVGTSGALNLRRNETEVSVKIDHLSSDAAYAALAAGEVELVIANRLPTEEERAAAEAAGFGDLTNTSQHTVLVEEATTIAVGDRVNVSAMSLPVLAEVFSGKTTDWSAFGLTEAPITLYGTTPTEGSHEIFRDQVLGGRAVSDRIVYFQSSEEVLDALAGDPYGIGFLNHSVAASGVQPLLALEDKCGRVTMPSAFSIKMGQYPLTRSIYGVTVAAPGSSLAKSFQVQASLDDGQIYLSAFDLIDSRLTSYPIDRQGRRLVHTMLANEVEMTPADAKQFFAELRLAERLSVDLFYEQDGGALTGASSRALTELADTLLDGRFDGKDILFVGFTDSTGSAEENKKLSLERAKAVEARFETMIPPESLRNYRVTSLGFGELSPLFCNADPAGQAGNRRVEVWVR